MPFNSRRPAGPAGPAGKNYKGFHIKRTDPQPPIPDRGHDWSWTHQDYDGPEDRRTGTAASPEACEADIDEYESEYNTAPKIPSMESMEILAVSDRAVFENLMNRIGLRVEGRTNGDPLEKRVQTEAVFAIASEITEGIHDFIECNPRLHQFKQMAEDYGYVVGFK